jgi:nucleoside-diphosphate-sugar epimerase
VPLFSLSAIYGPLQQPLKSLSQLNTSSEEFYKLMNGTQKTVPPTGFTVYVDVRDVALAHVRAIERPDVTRNQRYLLVAGHFSFDQIAAIISSQRPALKSKVPETDGRAPAPHYDTDNSKARKDLGLEFTSFEKMVLDTADRLVELEGQLH